MIGVGRALEIRRRDERQRPGRAIDLELAGVAAAYRRSIAAPALLRDNMHSAWNPPETGRGS
jgi:hypothetical protein